MKNFLNTLIVEYVFNESNHTFLVHLDINFEIANKILCSKKNDFF